MSQKLRLVLGAAGFVLLITVAVFAYNALREQAAPEDEVGLASGQGTVLDVLAETEKAPDFAMLHWDGKNAPMLSEMEGLPVVLNFWASWCPPCKNEMPDFETVYKELGEDIQFVMLNLTDGMRETKSKAMQYIEDEGYTFPVYFDIHKDSGASAYGIRYIPSTIFIDKDGYIIAKAQGAIDEATLRRGLELIK
jgi:thiol-disulfide isomerase/thioredoxin